MTTIKVSWAPAPRTGQPSSVPAAGVQPGLIPTVDRVVAAWDDAPPARRRLLRAACVIAALLGATVQAPATVCWSIAFVVGFALLWCAESFTFKLKERFRPFGYAAVGLIGYGVWSLLVFTATINSILAKVGESVLTNGQVGAIALNGAALGFVAFLFAKLLDVKLGNRKTVAIILLIAEIVIAIIGLLIMIRMFSVLYAA